MVNCHFSKLSFLKIFTNIYKRAGETKISERESSQHKKEGKRRTTITRIDIRHISI